MISDEQMELLMERMRAGRPEPQRDMDKAREGLGQLLFVLYERDSSMSAGEISGALGVSTARTAVLIRKMCEKGLAEKSQDPEDGRKTMVCLSSAGRKHAQHMRAIFRETIRQVAETTGYERFTEYLDLRDEIHEAMRNSRPRIDEEIARAEGGNSGK